MELRNALAQKPLARACAAWKGDGVKHKMHYYPNPLIRIWWVEFGEVGGGLGGAVLRFPSAHPQGFF